MHTRLTIVLTALAVALVVAPASLWASDRFADVPGDGLFHDEINALVDAGVTDGCESDRYCPDEAVTRAQMAALLTRLGALDDDSEPVVDAATVQGLEVHAETVSITVDNPEGNEEECVPQTSSLGTDIDFPAYTVTYELFAAPETGGQFTFDVNVALRYTEEVPQSGTHLVCFLRSDGQPLQTGLYSLYRQETYDPDWEPQEQVTP